MAGVLSLVAISRSALQIGTGDDDDLRDDSWATKPN
jgi:hypothetical protein